MLLGQIAERATGRTIVELYHQRWGHALFAGDVIAELTQREMRTLLPAAGNIPGETGAGLGIRGYGYLGRTQFGHSGGGSFGSSLLLFDPATGVTVVVLMIQGSGGRAFRTCPAAAGTGNDSRGNAGGTARGSGELDEGRS